MAYRKAPQEHAFISIEKALKAGRIPGLVVLCGSESYLTDHYLHVLVDRFTNAASRALDLTEYDRSSVGTEQISEAGETISLLSERKVIVVRSFIDEHGKFPRNFERSSTELKRFFEYLQQIPEGTLLILTCDRPLTSGDYEKQSDGTRLKKLKTAVKKAGGTTYEFGPLDQSQLESFVIKRFQKAGKNCTRQVLRRIVHGTGYDNKYVDYDLYMLENDLKKIIAHSGQNVTVTEADLDGILTDSQENNIFRMLDGIGRNRKDQALLYLASMLEAGEKEMGILAQIVRQTELMLIARQIQDEGCSRAQVLQYLEKKEKTGRYRAENIASAASRLQTARIRRMLAAALQIEEHIKTGLMSPRLALEYFISES